MEEHPQSKDEIHERLHRLEHEEGRLWRIVLLFLSMLAAALAATQWEHLASLPQQLGDIPGLKALPTGTFLLVVLFAVYVASKRHQVAELRGVVRGMQEREKSPPSEGQLSKLLEVISNSQRSYRELIDSLDTIVIGISLQGTIHTLNRACTDLLGERFADVAGKSLEQFLSEPTRAQAEQNMSRFLQTRHWAGVLRIQLKNETKPRFFDCVFHPIIDDGEVIGVSIMAEDITQQRERETRFTELFETLQEGVYFSTPDGRLLDCNNALVKLFGYDSKEQLLAAPVTDHYPDPSDRDTERWGMEHAQGVRQREIKLKKRDGTPIVCLDSARTVFDESGRVERFQGALIDISELRLTQESLHEQMEFRRRLVDSFPDLILVFDRDGKYKFVSARMRELLGYEPEEFIGRSLISDRTPASLDLQRMFHQIVTGKQNFDSAEYNAQHRDGSWRVLRTTASPVYDAKGEVAGVVASVRDMTDVKQMEQQLIQNERLAAMGQMIDGFAHELNNPLTAILGALELLETSTPDAATQRKYELVKQQARRAAEVVQNLLFFSRPPAPGKAPLNVSELVQRSLALHEHSLKLSGVSIDFLPDLSMPSVVGDPHQLMQVFLNLIINAEQAIREVRPRGTLRVRMGRKGQRVWVSFQDDGPGIPADQLDKIFDPFFTTKRPGRGTGLGLSVSLAILKKYDGDIEVQPAPGGGTVFTINLPAVKALPVSATAATTATAGKVP
jgi:PAS domain S-box-containing protein